MRLLPPLLLVPLLVLAAWATEPGEALHERVARLAADELQGRGNGTPGAAAAAELIGSWFRDAGLDPAGADGWYQDFPLEGHGLQGATGRNVLGLLPGRGPLADRVVVIGAHYDHLGLRLDDAGAVTGVYHGAEDNASGVAVLVELARRAVAADADARRTLLFAAFAGEEVGLQGSRWLVDHLPVPREGIDLMLNLDSVGRLRDARLYVGGVGSADGLRDLVTAANAPHGLTLELSDGGWDASDHVAFNAAGVPVLFLFTGPHPQYHSVDDTADRVEPAPLLRVAGFAESLLAAAAARPEPFLYRAVAELPQRPEGGAERAWLGTIPDFVDGVDGVRLAGVMPGSPAEESGLAQGDVVKQVGDVPVAGLGDLTVALRTHGVGEMVRVVFERDGERRELPVTLRPRPR
ncbi:MAG TPA: M20/M25/M40 family metallo-hydrolase [Candidatus Krumholzibacteria bacterium]|nr:M20/M25/M40 family metallo-hydrolase [Candidatus Krumholzibacteria bacterium]